MIDSDNPFERMGQLDDGAADSGRGGEGANGNPFDVSGSSTTQNPFAHGAPRAGDARFERSATPKPSDAREPLHLTAATRASSDDVRESGPSEWPRAVPVPAVLPERTAHAGGAPSATTSAARPPSQDARHLRTLDLTGRDKQLREAMGIMHRVAQNFCRAARRTLPFLVWRKAHLVPQSVAISAAPGRSQGPEGPSLHAIYHESAGTAWATVSLNAVSLALILEGALGASESRGSFTFGKELTLAQRALASRLIKALGQNLVDAVRDQTEAELELEGLQACPPDSLDSVLRPDGLSVDCTIDGVPGALITVSVQASALEAVVREHVDEQPQQGDPRMQDILLDVPVDVVAELGRLTLGLRKVLTLEPGQVLRLTTAVDDPIRLDVAGLKKFVGAPVVSRGQLAIEIKGRVGD